MVEGNQISFEAAKFIGVTGKHIEKLTKMSKVGRVDNNDEVVQK